MLLQMGGSHLRGQGAAPLQHGSVGPSPTGCLPVGYRSAKCKNFGTSTAIRDVGSEPTYWLLLKGVPGTALEESVGEQQSDTLNGIVRSAVPIVGRGLANAQG